MHDVPSDTPTPEERADEEAPTTLPELERRIDAASSREELDRLQPAVDRLVEALDRLVAGGAGTGAAAGSTGVTDTQRAAQSRLDARRRELERSD